MKRLKKTVRDALTGGLSVRKVSLAVALGLCLGIFPIYGPVSLICLGMGALLRLNVPILLAGVYSLSLVKPMLIVPFLRLGEWIFSAPPLPISIAELFRRFADAPRVTLVEFSSSFLHAFIGWAVVVPVLLPALIALALVLLKGTARLAGAQGGHPIAPMAQGSNSSPTGQ